MLPPRTLGEGLVVGMFDEVGRLAMARLKRSRCVPAQYSPQRTPRDESVLSHLCQL
jgi:hypothetical protein